MISFPIKLFVCLQLSLYISMVFSYINRNGHNFGKILVKREDEPNETVEVKIMRKLERLRKTIPVGNPESNIPIFDPFHVQNYTFDNEYHNLRFKGFLKDINVYGLKYFYVDKLYLHIFPVQLDLDVTLPSLHISSGHYNLKAKIYNFIPIFAKGQLSIKCNAKFKSFLKISLKEKFIRILDFSFEPSISDFNFKVTGILGNKLISKLFSEIVTALFPRVFEMLQKFITKKLSMFGLEAAKYIFGDITVREVLQILGSNDDGLLN